MFLALGEARRAAVLPHLVSFATGTLLGAAFLGLLPHALDQMRSRATHAVGLALLLGILTFFLLEKFVLWRHCHDDPLRDALAEPQPRATRASAQPDPGRRQRSTTCSTACWSRPRS
ncbi:MAG: ZIP family metal transporter [Comamonadaceae bacterium]|nr:ZIP family metal transporter [Comamonadaceae bacterium]